MRGSSSKGRWDADSGIPEPATPEATVTVSGIPDAPSQRTNSSNWTILRITPTNEPFLIGWLHANVHTKPRFYIENDENDQPRPAETDAHGCLAIQVGREDIVFVARPLDPDARLSISVESICTHGDMRINNMPHY